MNAMTDDFPSPAELSPAEQVVYQMIYEAADMGLPCPVNIDFEVAVGFESCSMGPKTVHRLETKGLIEVERFANRYRRIRVVATGRWTAFDPRQKTFEPHVPKGSKAIKADAGGTYRINTRGARNVQP